ncbi:MAG: prephenate/arogenate dehydrogenase [Cyanobacteriota bacterium]|nr:prephenate/arogenate dehydrogenase [Cyanobacteriota bacterium]
MKVGIVGLGLIGGSLGLDLRSQGITVLGVSRYAATCEVAKNRGAVDEASTNVAGLKRADIIFICTPLEAIAPTIEQLIPFLSPHTILTDVGSVKQSIVATCSSLWPRFVGGHPMAGTAQQGIKAAQSGLFAGAPYVLTPGEKTPPEVVEGVESIARSLGARVYVCSPELHDRAVAFVSHLPLFVSAGLIQTCLEETASDEIHWAQQLASSGFRDTSRVGGGNPELGVAIARHNRSALLRALSHYRQTCDHLLECIEGENWQGLEEILISTRAARSAFLRKDKQSENRSEDASSLRNNE